MLTVGLGVTRSQLYRPRALALTTSDNVLIDLVFNFGSKDNQTTFWMDHAIAFRFGNITAFRTAGGTRPARSCIQSRVRKLRRRCPPPRCKQNAGLEMVSRPVASPRAGFETSARPTASQRSRSPPSAAGFPVFSCRAADWPSSPLQSPDPAQGRDYDVRAASSCKCPPPGASALRA